MYFLRLLLVASVVVAACSVSDYADTFESGSGEATVPPPTGLPPVYEVYPEIIYGNLSCEVYQSGGLCQYVIPGQLPVLTNFTRGPQIQVKNDLDKIFYVLDTFGSSQQCFQKAVEILCLFTFPYCDPAYRQVVYQPICRWDCRTMRDFICPLEWEQMRNLQGLISFGTIDDFDCELLEPANGGESPMCIGTLDGGPIPSSLLSGRECYSGDGRGYTGRVNVTASGYTCQSWNFPGYPHQHYLFHQRYPELEGGHNHCRNPGSRGSRPWCFTTNRTKRWDYCDIPECSPEPVCERYEGTHCRGYGTIGMDYIFINRSIASQQMYEEQMDNLKESLANFKDCEQLIIELTCHVNFPTCDLSSSRPTPRKVCRQYCARVRKQCANFYDHLKNFESVSGLSPLVVPQCDDQDSDEASGGDNPECFMPIPLELRTIPPSIVANSSDCYNVSSNGTDYVGVKNVTVSRRMCQAWDSQRPHVHPLSSLFRRYLEGHNYCRNPDGRGQKPWCYTTDIDKRWEYCDISECISATPSSSSEPLPTYAVIGIGTGGGALIILLLLILIVAGVCVARSKSRSKTMVLNDGKGEEKTEMKSMGMSNDYGVTTKSIAVSESEMAEYLNGATLPLIKRDQLMYVCDLGEGHFGKVLKAEAIDIVPGKEKAVVAVKVLKEGMSHSAKKEFFREACLMNSYNHKNIVKLLGVCIKEEPLCMVFEYMEMGDLHSFLRQNAPAHTFSFPQSGPKTLPNGLHTEQMVSMCVDIAGGLSYLATHHYIHRDLATRNCLVDSNLSVKISDFGMSQDIYVSDYFRLGDSEMLPIRWMPPEAIMYSTFSIESDVWSFGVVLWEIFSYGMQPYYGMSNEEVVHYVKDCKVLQRPERCPQEIYDLMLDCCTINPKERPKAKELYEGLQKWTPELSAQVKSQSKEEHEYQNMSAILQWAASKKDSDHNYMLLEQEEEEVKEETTLIATNNGFATVAASSVPPEESPNYQNHSTAVATNGIPNKLFLTYDKLAPQTD